MFVIMIILKFLYVKYKNSGDEERKINLVLGRRKILVFY